MAENTRARDTTEHMDDPAWGVCARCMELGPWMPFYQHYMCPSCVRDDQEKLAAGLWPWPPHPE